LEDVYVKCTAASIITANSTRDILTFLKVNEIPCLQDAQGNYCFLGVRDFLNRVTAGDISESSLATGCTDCTAKYLIVWGALESDPKVSGDIAAIDLLCLKRDGDWCVHKWIDLEAAHLVDGNTTSHLDIPCHACISVYLRRFRFLTAWLIQQMLQPLLNLMLSLLLSVFGASRMMLVTIVLLLSKLLVLTANLT